MTVNWLDNDVNGGAMVLQVVVAQCTGVAHTWVK